VNQLKTGALLSYISLGLSNLIGILYTPFMLRMMGQSEYGLYALVISIVSTLALLDFGIAAAIIRYTAKYRANGETERLYSMFGMFILLYSFIGIICLILGLIIGNNIEALFGKAMSIEEIGKAKLMVIIISIYLSINFPLSIFGSIIIAYENFIFQKLINILSVILMPCIMIPMLLLGYKSVAMAVVMVIVGILTLTINIWFCLTRLNIKIEFNNLDYKLLKEIAPFIGFVFLKMVLDRFYWSSGQFVLGAFAGTASIAIFSISLQMRGYFYVFANAINGVFLPKLTLLATKKNSVKLISDLFIKISRIQLHILGFILCGYLIFGQIFIDLWAGKEYHDSYLISIIIIIPYIIPLIQGITGSILLAYNRQEFQVTVFIIISILVFGLSFLLGKDMGGLGCAIALAISIIVGEIVLMNWFYWKKIGLDIPAFWAEISRITLPMVIISSLFKYFFICL
jgi:O-antigen/teichoic acid export membrane protein